MIWYSHLIYAGWLVSERPVHEMHIPSRFCFRRIFLDPTPAVSMSLGFGTGHLHKSAHIARILRCMAASEAEHLRTYGVLWPWICAFFLL
jgi:hypothetical protein